MFSTVTPPANPTATDPTTAVRVQPIDPARLAAIRADQRDGHGNAFVAFDAEGDGGEPLRCCLRRAEVGERIALISHAPFDRPSPWREVGPVFVHADGCGGPERTDELPAQLRTGPLVLRTYRPGGAMNYDRITLVADGEDIGPALAALLADDGVDVVHVRTVRPQCFLYAVQNCR